MRETQRAVMVSLRVIFCRCLQTDKSKYSRGLYCATALNSCSPESLLLVSVSPDEGLYAKAPTLQCPNCSRSFIEPTAIFDHTSDNTMMDVMTLRHSIHEFQNSVPGSVSLRSCTRTWERGCNKSSTWCAQLLLPTSCKYMYIYSKFLVSLF